uniref:TAR DNA-binding protein 43 N-terminal domain-containing protein n=1 Tax=Parascaris univalens TaxID=6257 RepID=A0A914ZF90_PARUN
MGDNIDDRQRRVLRVYVEPVEVELDEDGALLFSALQSAVPGASGLYFNGECKSSVKFDGKRLLPPADGWKDRKYFAALGCRSDFPFGSYANASKQFERSVNAVQRLFGKCTAFDYGGFGQEFLAKKVVSLSSPAKESENRSENMKQLMASLTQKQSSTPASTPPDDQRFTPLEQQFVDLARISTAKDTIIEQQRSDIKAANEKFELKAKELKQALDELSKSEKRCNAQEEELNVLRNLSKEQTYMCEKVNELTKRLLDADEIIAKQKAEINDILRRLTESETEREASAAKVAELTVEVEAAKGTIEDLESRIDKLKPLAEIREITDDEEVLSYVKMSESLASLRTKNEKLEGDMKEMEEKYSQLNQIYTEVVAENTKALIKRDAGDGGGDITIETRITPAGGNTSSADDILNWQKERETLRSELVASENKVAELTRMVHSLTKEATYSEHRASEAIATRNELKRSLDHMEAKIQITISK